jgi:hypothetical protein
MMMMMMMMMMMRRRRRRRRRYTSQWGILIWTSGPAEGHTVSSNLTSDGPDRRIRIGH